MLISNIDYRRSTGLTITGRCPTVSHGLHSIPKSDANYPQCVNCGISYCCLEASKGETHSASTGWQHEKVKENVYLIHGSRGSLYISAPDGTQAMEIYLQS